MSKRRDYVKRRGYSNTQVFHLARKIGLPGNTPHQDVAFKLASLLGWAVHGVPYKKTLARYFAELPEIPGAKRWVPKSGPVKVFESAYINSDSFLASYEWRKTRMEVLKRDGAKCACCGATPADGVKMNVDHIKPRRLFPHLALDLNNLQVLCEVCNHGKGNWDMTDWRKETAE